MGEEAPPSSSNGELGVELKDSFEPNYLTDIPAELNSVGCSDKPNPWVEPPSRLDNRRILARLQQTPLQNDFHEAQLSMANPTDYTPLQPSKIPKPSFYKRPSTRARTKPAATNVQPKSEPMISGSGMNHVESRNHQAEPSTLLQPPILQPPSSSQGGSRPVSLAHTSQSGWQAKPSTPHSQPQFASAPTFTRFSNGSAHAQVVNNFSQQYNSRAYEAPGAVPPAHSSSTNLPNINRPGINAPLNPQLANPNPILQTNSPFPSMAQPVKSPLEDFIRHLSGASGLDYSALMQQVSLGANDSILLNVPPAVDNSAFRSQVSQAQAYILSQTQPYYPQQQQQQHQQQQPQRYHQQPHQLPPYQQLPSHQQYQQHHQLHYRRPIPGQPPRAPYAHAAPQPKKPTHDDMVQQDLHVDAVGDDEYHEVETYADYEPAKLQIGKPHPDPVVETSSLSTVEPPDVQYTLKLPSKVIDGALLSSLQLESVIYACQQHAELMPDRKTRRGFLIGDGAGVGKGRTIAGIIFENWLCGRKKSIWLSVSTDLKLDAERDLKDIGAKIPVFLLNKFQYGRRINEDHGVIFTTYSGLVSKSQSVKGSYGSRLSQLVAWAGASFDGVIVFDECHKAKNITLATTKTSKKLSKTAEHVLEIQSKLPNARIVYASATGASETRHLGYMTRLGIWGPGTPYSTFANFCEAIERRGVGAMELVAVELKMRGSYIARQLSFKTTSFSIERASLTPEFIELYDQCVDMWTLAHKHFSEAESYFSKKQLRSMWPTFWAAHQKFFKYMCISAKVPVVIDIVEKALIEDKCIVIGLQSTGEAKTLEALDEGDITEFVSTARATFESLIENHFPAPFDGHRRRGASVSTDSDLPSMLAPTPSDKSSSAASASTIIDDQWIFNDACKFVVKDGMVLPEVDENRPESSKSRKKTTDKNQRTLHDPVTVKRTSARTLRHKRRLAMRQPDKSRIKKSHNDDSDTEASNLLSDNERILSSSDATMSGASDSEYDADTVTEFDGSDDELMVVGTKSARRAEKNRISDDSDDDILITAVKTPIRPARAPVKEIVIESDEDEFDEDQEDEEKEMSPMIKHRERLIQMREELYAQIDSLGPKLPNNTLDDLIDRLGGPMKVAEMTGRKGRVVKDDEGQISYRQRNEIDTSEALNIEEKKRFMDGEKLIAIISEAASSGISLQADRRIKNTRRRVHITIELPWSADRAIQQFGRTHRSNQISGPEYVFIISDLAGETRFASIVAKRLESLGALTHGDRRATSESRDLSQFNMNSKYCRKALENMNHLLEFNSQFAEIRPDYKHGNFLEDARLAYLGVGLGKHSAGNLFCPESSALNVNLFLNRILGMKVHIQNAVFDLFTRITDRLITRKKVAGEYDAGILELNSASGKTRVEKPETFIIRTGSGFVKCTIRNIRYERGISWEEAKAKLLEATISDTRNGFYVATNSMTKSKSVILAIREAIDQFRLYKPNVGRQQKLEMYSQVIGRFDKVTEDAAERIWTFIYQATDTHCIHMCHFKSCKRLEANMKCDVGIRHRMYCIISGGILTVWPYLEGKVPEATQKIQIIRLRLDDNTRVIGPNITQDCLDKVRRALRDAETMGIDFNSKKR